MNIPWIKLAEIQPIKKMYFVEMQHPIKNKDSIKFGQNLYVIMFWFQWLAGMTFLRDAAKANKNFTNNLVLLPAFKAVAMLYVRKHFSFLQLNRIKLPIRAARKRNFVSLNSQ